MTRDIYLLIYPVVANKINHGRAHWAIWVPEVGTGDVGKVIQVVGSTFTGFALEFKRNYKLIEDTRPSSRFFLGSIDSGYIADATGVTAVDVTPRDTLEVEAKRIDAPGATREPLNPHVGRRCQDWTREYVEVLISKGILPKEAIGKLDEAKATEVAFVGSSSGS